MLYEKGQKKMIKMKQAVTSIINAVEKDKNKVNKEIEKIKVIMEAKEFTVKTRGLNKFDLIKSDDNKNIQEA